MGSRKKRESWRTDSSRDLVKSILMPWILLSLFEITYIIDYQILFKLLSSSSSKSSLDSTKIFNYRTPYRGGFPCRKSFSFVSSKIPLEHSELLIKIRECYRSHISQLQCNPMTIIYNWYILISSGSFRYKHDNQ